jgi:hypothetical protein
VRSSFEPFGVRSSFEQQTLPEADAVFVDRTGRRRWLVLGLGLGIAVVLLGAIALLVAALAGASPVPIPGLPGADQHQVVRGEAGAVKPSPTQTFRRPSPSPSPRPVQASPTPSASAVTVSPTGPPGHRRTAHPGNPKPSRTK